MRICCGIWKPEEEITSLSEELKQLIGIDDETPVYKGRYAYAPAIEQMTGK